MILEIGDGFPGIESLAGTLCADWKSLMRTIDLKDTKDRISEIETFLVRQVARTAPWLAPLPTAYVVYRSTMEHLEWPDLVAVAAALVIEGLGLSTISVATTFRDYNQTKRKSDPKAPTTMAAILVGVDLVVAIALTVALDIVPAWALFAPGIFPFLSLCGMTVVALQNDHEQRLAAIAEDKAKRSKANTSTKSPKSEPDSAQKKAKPADGCELCWCGMEIQAKPQAKSAHGRRHANDVRRILATGSGATLQTVATELETLYGQQPPDGELRRLYNKYRTDF